MGIFDKKEYVCEKCGKTFQKRINLNGNLCDSCWNSDLNENIELEKAVSGYVDYAKKVLSKKYSSDEMKQIIERREQISEKYINENAISRFEIQDAGNNYKELTDIQAFDILTRIAKSTAQLTMGAAYTSSFFAPTHYEGVIVDAQDVFAVGYTTDYRLDAGTNEVILCAVFTNDPYVPVFPMIYVGKTGFFELIKSKKGRETVNALFEGLCPNLTYPVGDIKQLKKQIKQEVDVKGNVSKEFMLEQISNASDGYGIFNTKKMHSNLLPGTIEILDNIGYIPQEEINNMLHMDKFFNRKYWQKQIENLLALNGMN